MNILFSHDNHLCCEVTLAFVQYFPYSGCYSIPYFFLNHSCIYIYIYIGCGSRISYHHYHHYRAASTDIPDPLSPLLPIIHRFWHVDSGLSSHNCCMYVRAGRPAFAWLYAEVHRSTSLMSSSLLLQHCPACLVRLTCIVLCWEAGGRIVGALWGVAARTCSILLAAFLCNCRLASFSAV